MGLPHLHAEGDSAVKIVSLSAKNVKRLRAVEIHPDGSVVVIGGKNGQGKTSVLDSIEYALGGKDSICREPLRRGEKSGEVVCDLGDLVVRRTFAAEGPGTLTVDTKDGARLLQPQTRLDDLIGRLSFDPLAFSRMSEKEQSETLRNLVGLDFRALDGQRITLFEARTEVNREGKALAARLSALPAPHLDVPSTEISSAEVIRELDAATSTMTDVQNQRQILSRVLVAREAARAEVGRCELELEFIKRKLESASSAAEAAEKVLAEAQEDLNRAVRTSIDPEPIKARLQALDGTNRKVRENAARVGLAAELEAKRAASKQLTTAIDEIDAKRTGMIGAARFPVAGLGFDAAGGVTLAGLPFSQASSAEQLRVSAAMGLALNPKLRILLIRDGSLLDEESMKLLADMAAAHDAQLWIERVEKDGATVIIEDGMVAAAVPAS